MNNCFIRVLSIMKQPLIYHCCKEIMEDLASRWLTFS